MSAINNRSNMLTRDNHRNHVIELSNQQYNLIRNSCITDRQPLASSNDHFKSEPYGRTNGRPKIRNSSSNSSEPNYVNLTVGDYIVIKEIEASSLYKCVNHVTSKVHLCKIVETKNYHDYVAIYIKLKDNPGINRIHEICVGLTYTIITFEKSYGDLHSYIRNKKKLTEAEARKFFHQITLIVADCHKKGIILRDIKLRKFIFKDPQQTQLVLETWDDAVILTNPSNDLLYDKHGCPTYVSPEILSKSTNSYSGRIADCWSLGVILFTMLAGRYPFHDSNPNQLFTKIRRGAYQIPPTISSTAEFIIRSLLRKQPSERLTAQDLLHARWFTERDAYLEPDDLLPESRLLEADDFEHPPSLPTTQHPSLSSISSPAHISTPPIPPSSTSQTLSSSSTRPFSIASILSSPVSSNNRHPTSSTYSSIGSSVNESKSRNRMISLDQIVPNLNYNNSDESFQWSLTSDLMS